MSGLFGGGGDGGASAQMAKQQEQLAKQEAQLAKKESNLAAQTQAGVKARRGGGVRSLLSAERPDELGIQPTKLGGGS
jgi:hypothetical protein